MRRGLLIVDRGSREREAYAELEEITDAARSRGGYDFADFCFLEVLPPYIPDGMKKCLAQKLDTLTIVPYFLYPGKKIKATVNDVMAYQKDTPTKFLVTRPMRQHPAMVDLVDRRIAQAMHRDGLDADSADTDVLVIGHGSKDPNAQMSINYVVDRLRQKYRNVERCFLEIEQPDIEAGIRTCEANDPKVLVVVFYFLHEGAHVKRDIYADLNPALERSSLGTVCITRHIGADDAMVNLILERAGEVERTIPGAVRNAD